MVRTFIAVRVSDSVRQSLADLIGELRNSGADVKWVAPENLHLTMKFLGNVLETRVDEMAEAVSRACEGISPFEMSLEGVGAFPSIRRPKVVWVGVIKGKDVLINLNKNIEAELEPIGFERERRRFSPHLTIGRLRREGRPGDLADRLSMEFNGGECVVESVYLMKSTLTPKGPIYEELKHATLKHN